MPDARTLKLKGPLLRSFQIELGDVEARADVTPPAEQELFDITISTEAPVERYDWWTGKSFLEVLGHNAGEIDMSYMSAGAAVLEEHRGVQIGVVEKAWIDTAGKRLRGTIRFSKNVRGREARQDVIDGIRRHISVGYDPKQYKTIATDTQGMDTVRATRWTPYESSVVGIPADLAAGVGRAKGEETEILVPISGAKPREGAEMPIRMDQAPGDSPAGGAGIATPAARTEKPAVAEPGDHGEDVNLRSKAAADIFDMAVANGCEKHAGEWVRQNLDVGQVARKILELRKTQGGAQPSAEELVDQLPEKDWSRFSYARAILAQAGEVKFDGIEREVDTELRRHLPEKYQHRGGVMVPMRTHKKRTLATGLATAGAELVFDEPRQLIDLLRNVAMVVRRGATVLTGLQGNIAFPKQTGGMTVYWVGENPGVDVTASDPAFGLVLMSPKTMQGTTAYSRQLLAQAPSSGVDIENIVRNDLAIGHALAWDRASIHGLGTNGEPLGIYQTPDVQTKAMGGAVDFAELVDMIGKIATANALTGAIGWLTSPAMAARLMAKLKDSVAGAAYIWTGTFEDGQVAGYAASATNQVSSTMSTLAATGGAEYGIIAGVWPELMIGMWGALELVTDIYAKKKQGLIEVTSFQMADVAIRHPESFCVSTGATLA